MVILSARCYGVLLIICFYTLFSYPLILFPYIKSYHSVGLNPFRGCTILYRGHLRPIEKTDIYVMLYESGKITVVMK